MTGYFRYMTWLYNKIKTGIQRGIAILILFPKNASSVHLTYVNKCIILQNNLNIIKSMTAEYSKILITFSTLVDGLYSLWYSTDWRSYFLFSENAGKSLCLRFVCVIWMLTINYKELVCKGQYWTQWLIN